MARTGRPKKGPVAFSEQFKLRMAPDEFNRAQFALTPDEWRDAISAVAQIGSTGANVVKFLQDVAALKLSKMDNQRGTKELLTILDDMKNMSELWLNVGGYSEPYG